MITEHGRIGREFGVGRGDGRKTIFFEEMYDEDISRFRSSGDVDSFLKEKMGVQKLEIKHIETNLVSRSGNILKVIPYDVQRRFRRMLGI